MKQNQRTNKSSLLVKILTMSSLIVLSACQIQNQPAGAGQCVQSCSASSDCSLGQVCGAAGCCEAYQPGASACDTGHPDCITIDDICNEFEGGCNCNIITSGDYQLAEILPVLSMSGSQPMALDAQVSAVNGDVITNNGFTLYADDPSCLNIQDNQVTGAPYPCSTTIFAEFGKAATCEAHVLNLGEPSPFSLRIFAYDESTGAPVARATVIIDHNNDGVSDILVPATNETGSTHFELDGQEEASITLMARGYHYVSFVGLALEEGKTLHIPLSPISISQNRSGVSGTIDFESHRENHLDGLAESIQLALVAPSFPLRSLVQFDIDTILGGPMPATDCSEGSTTAGCYNLGIPGITDEKVPLWGGMFFSFQASALKPFFEVRSTPGARALWSLGGEWSYEEIAPLAQRLMTSPECLTDLSSCLENYRFSLASNLLREWAPLMARLSFGSQSNVSMHSVNNDEWHNYINTPYGDERNEFTHIPFLDSEQGSRNSVELNKPASNYTQIIVPELPMGPAGRSTDALIALTGVSMTGSGFIPTGIAAGFDCYGDNCQQNRDGHDKIINAVELCSPDNPATSELCREDIPQEQPAGSIGLFHSNVDGNLAEYPQKTIVMAMPLDVGYEHGLSATALILEGDLPALPLSLEGVTFPQHLEVELAPTNRSVSVLNANSNVSVVTIYPGEENSEGPHWTIYGNNNQATFTLPEGIAEFGDPLASSDAKRFLRISNMHLRSGHSLGASLLEASGMKDLFNDTIGFATHHQTW